LHGTVTDGDFDLEADVTLDNIVAEISAHMSADGNVMAPNLETGVDVFIKGMFFTFGFFSDYDGASRTIDGSIFVAGDVVGWMAGKSGGRNDGGTRWYGRTQRGRPDRPVGHVRGRR
jgi:hypothetical protein